MANKSLLDKVSFIFKTVKNHNTAPEALDMLMKYTKEHTDDMVLGRFFGYSVSDYSIAALKWLNTEDTNLNFERIIKSLPSQRQHEINELVSKELYKQY